MYRTARVGAPRAALGPTHTVTGDDLGLAFERLRLEEGIRRISAIGGRFTATQLVDAGLIQDIYLTTTSLEGGEPGHRGIPEPPHHGSPQSPANGGTRADQESCLTTS